MSQKSVRIGTRGSKLALFQTYKVKEELEKNFPDVAFEVVIIKTKGDKILDVPLSKIGDKGLFTKELEVAMFDNEIDMAVHSLKDLPTSFPEGAKLGAVLKREEFRDAVISCNNKKLSDLTTDDVIATSSLRRKAQLLKINKDFNIIEIRGNVNTRIRKMQEGYCDIMLMAAAGLQRLEMDEFISEVIDPETLIPACGQGAIGIEIRDNDTYIENIITQINHEETWISTKAERAFLKTLEGGCQIPVGSYSRIEDDKFYITGFISSIDGSRFLKEIASSHISHAVQISIDLAKSLYKQGGKEILESIRVSNYKENQENLPLVNKVIISTRPIDPTDNLADLLQNQGATVISLPMIEIIPSNLNQEEIDLINETDSFDWLFFTSKNGVSNFFKHLIDLKGSTELPKTLKTAVIGSKTASELDYYGYSPDFVSERNTSQDFLKLFYDKYAPKNLKILLALGNLANDDMMDSLSIENDTQRINVYQTLKPGQVDNNTLDIINKDQYDLIVFTSPSTFRNFCSFYRMDQINKLKIASIGSTTSKAITDAGLKPLITANKSNSEGLLASIIEYYSV